MYLEYETPFGDDAEITLTVDSSKSPFSVSLRLTNGDGEVKIENIEPHKLGQFVINTRRILTMLHEDDALSQDIDDDDDDD